jgi:DMSO/TMAO reductase YedYZ molybdopterin-dependent catalytic subunit
VFASLDLSELITVPSPSKPAGSWVFTLDELRDAGAFLATHMNGEPLTVDLGAPIRLLVPGWCECCCAKWVDTVRVVDDSVASTSQMLEFTSRTLQVDPRGDRSFAGDSAYLDAVADGVGAAAYRCAYSRDARA